MKGVPKLDLNITIPESHLYITSVVSYTPPVITDKEIKDNLQCLANINNVERIMIIIRRMGPVHHSLKLKTAGDVKVIFREYMLRGLHVGEQVLQINKVKLTK